MSRHSHSLLKTKPFDKQAVSADQQVTIFMAALALSAVLCLDFPAVIYHGNPDEIDLAFGYIALSLVPLGLTLAALLSTPAPLLTPKAKQIYAAVLGSFALIGWILGTFLIGERGSLTGDTLLRSDSKLYQITEFAGVLTGSGLVVWLASKAPKLIRFILLVLILLSVGMAALAIYTDENSYSLSAKEESFYHVSSTKNVFIFVFDGFLTDLFERILKSQPKLVQDFDGFTYFPKTTGVAPTTILSLPSIHSGMQYPGNMSVKEYYRRAVRNGSFMTKLAKHGYDAAGINFVKSTPDLVAFFRGKKIKEGFWKTSIKEALYLFDISLYRAVPSMMKASVFDRGEWFTAKLFDHSRAAQNNKLLEAIGKKFNPSYQKPCVRWMHLYSTHSPASVDANCNELKYSDWNMQTAQNQATCAVRVFVNALRDFKRNGIYDNSVIFLIADHGIRFSIDLKPPLLSSARPVFLVKPIQSRGNLQVSETRLCLTDFAKTVCSLTKDCAVLKGFSAFEDKPLQRSSRAIAFYDYEWRNAYWHRKHLPNLSRHLIRGPTDNVLSWYKDLPHANLSSSHLSFAKTDDMDAYGLGWSEFQKDHSRLVMGKYAQIYLPLKIGKDATLAIRLKTDIANQQTLKIYVNNQEAGQQAITAGKELLLTFKIPALMVTEPVTRVTFEFSHAQDPSGRQNDDLAVAAEFHEVYVTY